MSYSIDLFKNLPSFDSWESLKEWLTSSEGGKLRVIEPRDSSFAIIRYVKGQSTKFDWFRSVVVDKSRRIPVCVAPPKASTLNEESVNEADVAEEFVDGTMINLFLVKGETKVHMATRSRLGGNTRFYENGKTFEEMLNEALKENSIERLEDIVPDLTDSTEACFISLVLQHPSNRIVKNISKPTFVIIHQGTVSSDGIVQIQENAEDFKCVVKKEAGYVDFFEVQPYNLQAVRAAKTIEAWVTQYAQEKGFGWQGLVLKDGRGKRWRVRSQVYETVRRIRGNESSPLERYARLRRTRTVEQYLAFYPEDHEVFYEIEGQLRKNTRQLVQLYADAFRSRKTPYHELPWPYKHHVSVLHNLFKTSLREIGKKVDLDEVIRYVNTLPVEDLANMMKVHSMTPSQPKNLTVTVTEEKREVNA